MTTIKRSDIIKAMQQYPSIELEGEGENTTCKYYLHLTEDGQIVSSVHEADVTCIAKRDIREYVDDESPERVYDTEVMTDKTFAGMISDMLDEVRAAGFEVAED